MLVEPRRDERPHLVEHVRQRDQERRHQRDLERHEERAGHVGGDHRRARRQRGRAAAARATRRSPSPTGTSASVSTSTAMIARSSRSRSSIRCEMNVSCAVSGASAMACAGALRSCRSPAGCPAATARRPHRARSVRRGGGGSCSGGSDDAVAVGWSAARLRSSPIDCARLLEIPRGGGHAGLDVARRRLHLLLQLAQLVELHLAADVRLDVVDVALQPPEQVAERARRLRQPLGADDDQRDDGDDDDLGETDIEHRLGAPEVRDARRASREDASSRDAAPATRVGADQRRDARRRGNDAHRLRRRGRVAAGDRATCASTFPS